MVGKLRARAPFTFTWSPTFSESRFHPRRISVVGLGSSKGDVRRTLEGGGYRSNGVVLTSETSLPEQKLLHGRYLLLQRGRKSHHLVEVFS